MLKRILLLNSCRGFVTALKIQEHILFDKPFMYVASKFYPETVFGFTFSVHCNLNQTPENDGTIAIFSDGNTGVSVGNRIIITRMDTGARIYLTWRDKYHSDSYIFSHSDVGKDVPLMIEVG